MLLFCYQHWVPLVFLKWGWTGREGERREDGKSADKCRTKTGSHTKRYLLWDKTVWLQLCKVVGIKFVGFFCSKNLRRMSSTELCRLQFKSILNFCKGKRDRDGTFGSSSPSWCHPGGCALKGMGAEGHPGITMHCCISAALQGHDAILVSSGGLHCITQASD